MKIIRRTQSGFALPSVLIASIVMLAVLIVAVTGVSAVRMALTAQRYDHLAKQAAESGLMKAKECLRVSNGTITWSDSSPLRTNTDCNGTVVQQCNARPLNEMCGVVVSNNLVTTFSVGEPTTYDGKPDRVIANSSVNLVRTSSGTVWRTYNAQQFLSADMLLQGAWSVDGKIIASAESSCAMVSGDMWCWGSNMYGQLGTGNSSPSTSSTPLAVSRANMGTADITDLSGGGGGVNYGSSSSSVVCAIANGVPYCWGDADGGMMGNGTAPNNAPSSGTPTVMQNTPSAVTTSGALSGRSATKIAVGRSVVCVIASAKAYCWGGVTADGASNSAVRSAVPVDIDSTGALGSRTVTDVAVANSSLGRTCVVASQELWCKTRAATAFTRVNTGSIAGRQIASVFAGRNDDVCVIDTSRLAHCSDGYPVTPMVAVTIPSLPANSPIEDIAMGGLGTECLVSGGTVYCQGSNSMGLLANGTNTGSSDFPIEAAPGGIMSGRNIISIVAGYTHACALENQGIAYCWGGFTNNYGQLGHGGSNQTTPRGVPVQVVNPNPEVTRPGFFY